MFKENILSRHLCFCFVFFFILCVVTVKGFGQTTSSVASLPPAAREAINKGIIAAKVPDYLMAISYFEEARKIAPQSPEVFFNLGLAESKIPGRELRAICWFGAYLLGNSNAQNAAAIKEQITILNINNQVSLKRLLIMVQDAARQISKTDESNGLADVTKLWVNFGDIAMAQKACNLISKKDVYQKSGALEDIADALIEAGDIDGARKKMDNTPSAQIKYRGLISIAEAQLNAGDTVNAKKTLVESVETAKRIIYEEALGIFPIEYRQMDAFTFIAQVQAKSGDIAGAQNTVDLIKGANQRSTAYNYIAKAQAGNGDSAGAQKTLLKALEIVDLIKDANEKSYAYMPIAEIQAKIGDNAAAQKTADLIKEGGYKSQAYSFIAAVQAERGDIAGAQKTLTKAQETADLIKDANEKSSAYAIIAYAQAKSGDIADALKTAELINSDKSSVYSEIASAQAKSGDIAGAQKTADLITKAVFYKFLANRDIVEAQIKIGVNAIKLSDWIKKLDDKDETDVCPLNTEPFMDMDSYLKTLVRSEDAADVFKGLKNAAENIVKARNIVLQLLKIQMGN